MGWQCPKVEIETVDVEMCEESRTNEDATMGISLRWSSQKAIHGTTQSIRLQVKEWACMKTCQHDKLGPTRGRPLVSPQVMEPTTLGPLYVPIPDSKSSETDDFLICLEAREKVAPVTSNDTTCLEEMDKAMPIHASVKKMYKRFNQSMAKGSVTMGAPPKTQNV